MIEYQRVAQTFAAAAGSYAGAAALPREVESRLLERLQFIDVEIHRILDLGCGLGSGAAELARHFRSAPVLALDLALPMLRLSADHPELLPVAADAAALPFADASFELVYSNLALPWFADPGRVFAEVRRVLKPGGAFLFSTLGPDTLTELRASWAACDDRPHVHGFIDMHLLGDGLLECGFANPVMDMELIQFRYRDVQQLLLDLKKTGAANLACDRRRTLTGKSRFAAMRSAYEALRKEGRIPATYEIVYGLAWGPPHGQPRRLPGMDIATFPVDHLRRRD